MKQVLFFFFIAIFSIFIGSQITEGVLLVPYWKSLSTAKFYAYYATFGPQIGRFYTLLTVIAAIVPVSISIYCVYTKSPALKYSIVSTFFMLLVITLFYAYFKGTNQLFYENAFDAGQLKSVLNTWATWHWVRVFFEFMSLVFSILSLNILLQK